MQSDLPSHDKLSALAKSDPEALEALRTKMIDEIIDSAPSESQKRLRGIQFQIDCRRRLHSSPMGACMEISRMMHESLNKLNRLVNNESVEHNDTTSERATVLAFPTAG